MNIDMDPKKNEAPRSQDPLGDALAHARKKLEEGVAEVRIEDLGDNNYRVTDTPEWVAQFLRKGEGLRYVLGGVET